MEITNSDSNTPEKPEEEEDAGAGAEDEDDDETEGYPSSPRLIQPLSFPPWPR